MRSRLLLATMGLAGLAAAQTQLPIPAFSSTFSSTVATRGFYFQTPSPIVIVGLRVPDETANGIQNVEVSRLTGAAPAYPATAQGGQQFYASNVPSSQLIQCSIPFAAGDWIGILGACGTSTMANSYATAGTFQSSINGTPVTLTRFLTQTNLNTTGGNQPYSSEAAGSISRIEVYYTPAQGYASASNYGTGCPARTSAAVYELFQSATVDLSNQDLMFLPSANGSYTVIGGPNQWFSGFSNNLALGDDVCATVTMPFSFPHAGGTTSTISVSSNGFVWLGSNTNSACCAGDSISFLSDPMARISALWQDLYPPGAAAGGGVFADVNPTSGEYVITWNQVPEYSTNPPVTMQIALSPTGVFNIRYQTVGNVSHVALTGYSMGSVAVDPGSQDLSTVVTTPIVTPGVATPLALSASARPVLGTTTNLVTAGIASGTLLGVNVLGMVALNPGFDLTPIGAPGCFQYLSPAYTGVFVVGGPTSTMALAVPNNPALAGLHVYSQSLAFTSGYNALGIVFSNGTDLLLDLL